MLYAPRGPVVAPDDADALRALAHGLRSHARRQHAVFCKVDPAWQASIKNALASAGFRMSREAVQVTQTYTIDLRQSEAEILAGMRSKTRQYIRKAEREEITLLRDTTGEHVAACYTIYQETSRRAGFGLHEKAYYDHLYQRYPAERQYLYVAQRHGTPLSFLWMVCAGRHAVEFYGGVADAGQEFKSNYLLKWHAIQQMKAAGYEIYDLNGRVTEGIAQFKEGFGPAETAWIGPYDAVYHRLLYAGWALGLPLAQRMLRRAG
jgi:lipid II:glycine glycyltransferase (peptidoglycan interpeptide bridge formation enzyme)